MNRYYSYTAEELAADPSFAKWALNADSLEYDLWEEWLSTNPERLEVCLQAKSLVLAVHLMHQESNLPEQIVQQHIQHLVDRAEKSKAYDPAPIRLLRSPRWLGWSAAAAVLLLLGGFWLVFMNRLDDTNLLSQTISTQSSRIERSNAGSQPMTVLLSDGSVVMLSPKSSLSYPRIFTGEQRLVNLVGEAFFDVKKNPKRPFFVLTNRSVTKVLGTSFRVKAYPKDPVVNVFVRTGKVAVYAVAAPQAEQSLKTVHKNGVMLLPNQQVELKEGRLKKENVSQHKLVVSTQVGPSEITFDNQPVTDVLLTLSRLYEVSIDFDSQLLANCRITTSFAEETLSERLSSICRAINASYVIDNEKITVSSRGCSLTN